MIHAHKIIEFMDEAFDKLELMRKQYPSIEKDTDLKELFLYYIWIKRQLDQTIKFRIDRAALPESFRMSFERLPYENCYMEFHYEESNTVEAVILREESRDGEIIICGDWIATTPENGMAFEPQGGSFEFKNNDQYTPVPGVATKIGIYNHAKKTWANDMVELEDSMTDLIHKVIATLQVMNCSNIEYIDHESPQQLNKKRIHKNKPPIYSFKTLCIKKNKVASKNRNEENTHASPRLHLRRGHIRRCHSGINTWVQPCVVGDKTKGIVHKEYAMSVE